MAGFPHDTTPYPISEKHKRVLHLSGYNWRDSNVRFATKNEAIDLALAAKSIGKDQQDRAKALLNVKEAVRDGLERFLAWIIAMSVFLTFASTANATHPTWRPELQLLAATEIQSIASPPSIPLLWIERYSELLYFGAVVLGLSLIIILLWSIAMNTQRIFCQVTLVSLSDNDDIEVAPQSEPSTPTNSNPSPCHWLVAGETRKGQIRAENQDAFESGKTKDGLKFITVNDGAGGHAGGQEASLCAASTIASFLSNTKASDFTDKRECLELAIEHARQHMQSKGLTGLTTAIVCLMDGFDLHYATLGDGGLSVLWPDGMTQDLLVEHHAYGQPKNIITAYLGGDCLEPARVGTVRLELASIVFAMSDGASDLLALDNLAPDRSALGRQIVNDPSAIVKALMDQLEDARDPENGAYLHSDNLTLVLAHLPKEQ